MRLVKCCSFMIFISATLLLMYFTSPYRVPVLPMLPFTDAPLERCGSVSAFRPVSLEMVGECR